MRLDTRAFGIAAGAVAGATYIVCGLLVAVAPEATQAVFSYVMHADLTQLSRPISVASFIVGLVVFSALIGACAYVTAWLYNTITARSEAPIPHAAAVTR